MTPKQHHRQHKTLPILILSFTILLRILVGIHPHSGQDDYQGHNTSSKVTPKGTDGGGGNYKYGGDYEAQRHWMELTYHLPLNEWYHYDLSYWGLDYPPLTAYVSWIFGWVAHTLGGIHGLEVLRDLVALDESRGFEERGGKMYMRLTVLVMDLLVYCSAVWVLVPRLVTRDVYQSTMQTQVTRLLLMALAQPALILIDHGHFQYNTVSLGLALWSFHFITLHSNPFTSTNKKTNSFVGPIVGSVLFSLALNFKQMELYHAPAVFAYLLGRCFGRHENELLATKNGDQSAPNRTTKVLSRFCALGLTVIATFTLLWLPFAIHPQSSNSIQFQLDGMAQVMKRLFPFQRGLFEGKVSNIWCALSVKPISLRKRVPSGLLPFLALGLTLLLILPPCWFLFRAGQGEANDSTTKTEKSQQQHLKEAKELKSILWGSTATSLAFFLASFQVHEKGILIPLAPLSLLILEAPLFITWFSFVATWTLWPLIVVDRLNSAYACCVAIFLCLNSLTFMPSSGNLDVFSFSPIKYIIPLSAVIMISLHIAEYFIVPPANLPDLFPVIWSVVGCGMFSFSYLVTIWVMAKMSNGVKRQKVQTGVSVGKKKHVPLISMLGLGLLTMASLPTACGFIVPQHFGVCCSHPMRLLSTNADEIFSSEMLQRARVPLYWETQRIDDAKPVLDLSVRDSDTLSLSDRATVDNYDNVDLSNKPKTPFYVSESENCINEWEDGRVWLETEQQLISMGVLRSDNVTTDLINSKSMLDQAPQLLRLPTTHVIESTNFFMDEQYSLQTLIQLDPTILTYCADDLYYGIEYLSNMMTRGNKTQAIQMIQTQCKLSPSMALNLFKLGVDGGIDERRVANALGNAGAASGKAVEMAVGDAGRSYREFQRLKGGKNSLS